MHKHISNRVATAACSFDQFVLCGAKENVISFGSIIVG